MRIINKVRMSGRKSMVLAVIISTITMSGCGTVKYDMPYTVNSEVSSFRIADIEEGSRTATPFAADLCVVFDDISLEKVDMSKASAAALFNVNKKETVYAKNVHEKLYPASLTKVMTALVALKNCGGNMDMLLTASSNVTHLESGAVTCGLKEGDQMTLTQALYALLVKSANDAGIMIAEGIAGSIEEFAALMNEEALLLGATNTHFINPHGLPDDNHYTTAYDMYLIMNEAIKYDTFNEIIRTPSYTTVYHDKNGNTKELTINNSNYYFQGNAEVPSGVTVLGGKTGTTNAAGHCLILVSKDTANNPYISIILRADSRDDLYTQMTELLDEINN